MSTTKQDDHTRRGVGPTTATATAEFDEDIDMTSITEILTIGENGLQQGVLKKQ